MKEEDLRKNIAIAFVHLKEQQDELFEVKNQLVAMRDLMTEASPNFERLFSKGVAESRNRGRALNAETLARFDEIILRLRNG
jgi:hypothetical protein